MPIHDTRHITLNDLKKTFDVAASPVLTCDRLATARTPVRSAVSKVLQGYRFICCLTFRVSILADCLHCVCYVSLCLVVPL